jgi:small-conductance mechanosensitive channel
MDRPLPLPLLALTRYLVCGLFFACLVPVHAADVPLESGFRYLAAQWEKTLKNAESRIDTGTLSETSAERMRQEIDRVREQAQAHGRAVQRKVDQFASRVEALGPAPAEGAPPESPDVKRKREELNAALADLSGQVSQCDLTINRTDALLSRISAARFERRKADLLVRGPLPYLPETFERAASQLWVTLQAIHAREVVGGSKARWVVLPLVALGTYIAIVVGRLFRQRMMVRWGRDPSIVFPSYGRRLIAAVVDAVSRGLVPVVVIAIVLAAAWWLFVRPFLDPSIGAPLWLLYAIVFYLLVAALIRAAFSPEQPNWRLTPVSASASEKIGKRLHLLAAIIAIQMALSAFMKRFGEPVELATLHSFGINLLLAVLLLSMSWKRLWEVEETREWFEEQPRRRLPALSGYVRGALALIAVASVACNLLGYHALADYVLRNTILTLLLVGAMFAIRFLARESCSRLLTTAAGPAAAVRKVLGLSDQGGRTLSFWAMALIDLMLIVAGIVIGLALWGIPPRDVADWMLGIFGSFNIGTHKFSLTDVLVAIVVFGGIIVFTRLLQHFLEYRLLPNTRLDIGIRTAITSGVIYVGVAVAILAAISALGIGLTGIAVVAGALSVGIGFGLQNIVNNFISGIILLVERPVKVGDTVVVNNYEGVVRKIRVRSTEIETGLHASVIIPNADLLQNSVLNWTHHSRVGRVEVRVVAPFAVEPERIETLLLACANDHPQVVRVPAPSVSLINFIDRGAEYQLSFQLDDLDDKAHVASDVRKAILSKFRKAGIEIPSIRGGGAQTIPAA